MHLCSRTLCHTSRKLIKFDWSSGPIPAHTLGFVSYSLERTAYALPQIYNAHRNWTFCIRYMRNVYYIKCGVRAESDLVYLYLYFRRCRCRRRRRCRQFRWSHVWICSQNVVYLLTRIARSLSLSLLSPKPNVITIRSDTSGRACVSARGQADENTSWNFCNKMVRKLLMRYLARDCIEHNENENENGKNRRRKKNPWKIVSNIFPCFTVASISLER